MDLLFSSNFTSFYERTERKFRITVNKTSVWNGLKPIKTKMQKIEEKVVKEKYFFHT